MYKYSSGEICRRECLKWTRLWTGYKKHKPGLTPVSPIIIISRWGKQTARMHDLGWIHSSDLLNYIWVQQTARIHLNNLKMSQVKDRIGDADCSRRGWYHKMKWYSNYSSESSVILTNRQPAQSSHKSQPIIGVKTIQLGYLFYSWHLEFTVIYL